MPQYKNIIFDFGGVIIRIDYNRIPQAFSRFGLTDFDLIYSKLHQSPLFDEFEKGMISTDQFRERIREISGVKVTDDQIDEAWNAILIDIPEENVDALRVLKKNYRLFLLSNTNEIHEKAFTEIMMRDYRANVLEEVFEKIYFSHRINMRKPDEEIFKKVLQENSLVAAETLFVDDSPQHIEGAAKAGLKTLYLEKGKMIKDIKWGHPGK
jgi:putative hydrolase of the HAD superfamily